MTPLWRQPAMVLQSRRILDSYRRWLGTNLINRTGNDLEDAQQLFESSLVVVSHTAADDPILNYGNASALALWEMPFEAFTQTPSRLTAEPMHRDERAQLLARTTAEGYVDDYCGIRISKSGRRFRIEQATIWNVLDEAGAFAGQAAAFSAFTFLENPAAGGG